MQLKLPRPNSNKGMDWIFIDSWLDRFILELPDYLSKREFRTALAKKLGYPIGYKQDADQVKTIKRLLVRAQRTHKITSDHSRWQMVFVNKPEKKAISH